MNNVIPFPTAVAGSRHGRVLAAPVSTARTARPRLVMTWSVDATGRLVARWRAGEMPSDFARPRLSVSVENGVEEQSLKQQRAARSFTAFVLMAWCLIFTAPALADGGAHMVDSANVETPGVCHLETWVTRLGPEKRLLNLAPACTRPEMPSLEIGAVFQHAWDHADVTAAGPAFKLNLRPTETGVGMGILANGGLNIGTGEPETAALIVPISIPMGDRILLNFNGGWTYARTRAQRSQGFYGAQLQAVAARGLSAMAEFFGTSSGRPGFQGGLRWNPEGGKVDFDLLAGRRVDGSDAGAITLGITVRR